MKAKIYFLTTVFALITFVMHAQVYKVNPEKTAVLWTGEKIGGKHTGNIKLKSGEFTIKNGKLVSGVFIIDMTSITNSDLEDVEWRNKLIGHLKSEDFFNTEKYPTSKFEVTEPGLLSKSGSIIKGNLTIKGITNPLSINVAFQKAGSGLKVKADIVIDRTNYDIRYGSGKFFENLGDKTIRDNFEISIDLLADKK